MPIASWNDLIALSPLVAVLVTAAVVLVSDLFMRGEDRTGLPMLLSAGVIVSWLLALAGWGHPQEAFGGAVRVDDYTRFFWLLLSGVTFLASASSARYAPAQHMDRGEYYALLLLALSGMMALVAVTDLVGFFVALETLSISLYALAGFTRDRQRSVEAAMKYFILGALSAGFLLFGLALVYTVTGSFSYDALAQVAVGADSLLLVGAALLAAGLAFKVGAVPFHWWVPDVYEGSPAPVTGFMAAGVKAAGFAVLLRIVWPMHDGLPLLGPVLWVLAVATLVVGSVLAIRQSNVKRLLAYSSITHTGYMLIGVLAGLSAGGDMSAVPFYAVVYAVQVLGAFGVLAYLSGPGWDMEELDDLRGLYARRPGIAALLALFMVALAGIPPTAGFVGKFYLFRSAVSAGYVGLAVLGVLASVVSLFYYMKVVFALFEEPAPAGEPEFDSTQGGGLSVAVAGVLAAWLGLFPGKLLAAAVASVRALLA